MRFAVGIAEAGVRVPATAGEGPARATPTTTASVVSAAPVRIRLPLVTFVGSSLTRWGVDGCDEIFTACGAGAGPTARPADSRRTRYLEGVQATVAERDRR